MSGNRLEYDDAGWTFFALSLGTTLATPFTFYTLYQIFNHNKVDDKSSKARTEVEKQQLKLKASRKKSIWTNSFLCRIAFIIITWLYLFYQYNSIEIAGDIQVFNPWEVLGIEEGAVGTKKN